jgi:hypothetical protein
MGIIKLILKPAPQISNQALRDQKGGTPVFKRLMAGLAVLGVFLAFGVTAGVSATPRQIYKDLADNGRLDHKYTASDLNQAFRNPTFKGYHKPTQPLPKVVKHKPGTPLKTTKKIGVLPFTGMDLTFIAAGAILLILVGGSLRILVRKN